MFEMISFPNARGPPDARRSKIVIASFILLMSMDARRGGATDKFTLEQDTHGGKLTGG